MERATPDPAVNLLLVDDVEANLVALQALLRRPGLRLLSAGSGPEALEILLREDVALALLDVRMPGMSGFELAELMRGAPRTRHVPIIFLTAEPQTAARIFAGYEAGAVDFLFKPIDAALLRSKVGVFVELHRQRLQLAAQLEQLQEMLRLSDVFIGVLGHDLRNPLGAVRNGAELLVRQPGDPARVQRTAEMIRRSSDRMGRLIQQLLDYARTRMGGDIPLRPAPVDLGELCRGALVELEVSRERLVEADIQPDVRGEWDADRVLQVISNLVGNALEHGEQGQPVAVRVASAGESALIEVRNRGFIPPAIRERLFEPLARAEQARGEGLGLGLYIVDQIVRAHGGQVEVESSPSAGTLFRVWLPRGAPG